MSDEIQRLKALIEELTESVSDEEWPKRFLRGRVQFRPTISRREIDAIIFNRRLNAHADDVFTAIARARTHMTSEERAEADKGAAKTLGMSTKRFVKGMDEITPV